MSRSFPSMTALLGLLAVAGYQKRDKIGEWLGSSQSQQNAPSGNWTGGSVQQNSSVPRSGGIGGLLDSVRETFGGG